jgi:hypothetical protein
MSFFARLDDDLIVSILEYTRAVDMASAKEVGKAVFTKERISRAVRYQLTHIYSSATSSPAKPSLTPSTKEPGSPLGSVTLTPDYLFVKEIKSILGALNSSQPINGKGYWVSTSWVSNAKKYFEAISLPEINRDTSSRKGKSPQLHKKRSSKIRQRRGSDALPPWPAMNADLLCAHGNMCVAKSSKSAKRRLMDSKAWFFLRKFYPSGPTFKSSKTAECPICIEEDSEARWQTQERRDSELSMRKISLVPAALEGLQARKSGVPSQCLIRRESTASLTPATSRESLMDSAYEPLDLGDIDVYDLPVEDLINLGLLRDDSLGISTAPVSPAVPRQPLQPGIYNIIPRQWLKSWRQYTRDHTVSALVPMDCASLICQPHGKIVVPPHLREYLCGCRKSLIGGLGQYPGQVVEVLSNEEWEILQDALGSLSEFGVRFSLDGEGITWSGEVCHTCDPFNYNSHLNKKKPGQFLALPGRLVA